MLPRIGITLGDPAGVGPELLARTLASGRLGALCTPVVIGDARVLERALQQTAGFAAYQRVEELPDDLVAGRCYLIDLQNVAPEQVSVGEVSAAAGHAAGQFIEKATALAQEGAIDAVVTNPIHPEAFVLGAYGKRFAGHTEMITSLTQAARTCVMLVRGPLRVCLVTTHVPLLEALTKQITTSRILDVIELAHRAGQQLGLAAPTVGVAAINPHTGEGGRFGDEEQRLIAPAVAQARDRGIDTSGPLPADTLFPRAAGGEFDLVVAMYHDQGHIPVRLAGSCGQRDAGTTDIGGVEVTLGLPFIRTSVEDGAAFGRAGEGTADPGSLIEAIRLAAQLAKGSTTPEERGKGSPPPLP